MRTIRAAVAMGGLVGLGSLALGGPVAAVLGFGLGAAIVLGTAAVDAVTDDV